MATTNTLETPAAMPAIPDELRNVYDLLQNEVGALGYRLREYTALFNTSRERIELLNHAAPVFFQMLSETLWGDMLLHLNRVTGRATTGRGEYEFQNLTLRRLPSLVDDECRPALQTAVDDAAAAAAFTEPVRNKVYAHRDWTWRATPKRRGSRWAALIRSARRST